jgi:hypothetical protein
MQIEGKQIRAVYDDTTITVCQAYNKTIAEPAVKHQTFASPPFKLAATRKKGPSHQPMYSPALPTPSKFLPIF